MGGFEETRGGVGGLTGHDEVLADDALLVLVALHLDDGAGGRGVGCEEDVVLAGDAKRDCRGVALGEQGPVEQWTRSGAHLP